MKKHFVGGSLILALLCTTACDSTKKGDSETAESNTRVVDRDSVPTEYEVTETVVKYDTTQRKKTVTAEEQTKTEKETKKSNDDDVTVKKDKD